MPAADIPVNGEITLRNLYTDPAKAKANQYGCHFPVKPSPVWFASFSSGEGPETDYKITLTYDSADINALPHKGSPACARPRSGCYMLRTLVLKPPVVITKIAPTS